MSEVAEKKKNYSIVEVFMIVIQIILIPVLFSFNSRISYLEMKVFSNSNAMKDINKKLDELLRLNHQGQDKLVEFYKEYGSALDFSKREMQKK